MLPVSMLLQKEQLEQAMAMSLREAEAQRQRQEAEEQQLGQAAALERRFADSPVLTEVGTNVLFFAS